MIKDIYKINYMRDRVQFVGTLRNAKRFTLHENVFFAYGDNGSIARGVIVGIECMAIPNSDYIYKIKVPEALINEQLGYPSKIDDEHLKSFTMTCDEIFSSVSDAKHSATDELEKMYRLQKREIDNYFDSYLMEKVKA